MKFFKHFTDAHRGKSMQTLMRKHGPQAVGMYWTLVEMCAEKMEKKKDEEFTDEHCHFEFDRSYIRDTLQTHQFKTLEMYLRCFTDVGLMSASCVGDVVTIYMPKLLECLDRDSKRARTERAPAAPKIKNKDKDKEEDINKGKKAEIDPPEFFKTNECFEFFWSIRPMKKELLDGWLSAYPQEYLAEQLKNAKLWCLANEHKMPKNAGQFLTNWFKNGWDSYRKKLPSNKTDNTPTTAKDWKVEAAVIYQIAFNGGFSLSPNVRAQLGEERVDLIKRAGGLNWLRDEPNNDWTIQAFAARLRAANEQITTKLGA